MMFSSPSFFMSPPREVDPFWDNVSALLHMNGTDTSTTFTDETGKIWTASGNAQIDTAQSQFGGASGLFDGTTDKVATPDHIDFEFGTGDFTIEMWIRLNDVSTNHHILGKYNSATAPFAIYQAASQIGFYSSANGTTWSVTNLTFGTGLSIGVWYAIAITRSGNTFRTFRDGVLISSTTSTHSLYNNTAEVQLGLSNTGAEGYNGWMDEVRFTKGVARYTANYTPTTSEFPSS